GGQFGCPTDRVVETVEEHRTGGRDDLPDGQRALRAAAQQLRVQRLGLLARGDLDEQPAVADGQRPHAKASTRTPDATSRSRTRRASSTAPGVSPCRQSERARTSMRPPECVVTAPERARSTERSTTAAGSLSTAPSCPRGTSVPSSVYARSANAS